MILTTFTIISSHPGDLLSWMGRRVYHCIPNEDVVNKVFYFEFLVEFLEADGITPVSQNRKFMVGNYIVNRVADNTTAVDKNTGAILLTADGQPDWGNAAALGQYDFYKAAAATVSPIVLNEAGIAELDSFHVFDIYANTNIAL